MLTLEALLLGEVAAGVGVALLLVGVLVAVFVVAVGLVDPPVVVLPQAARKTNRVRTIRENPVVLKKRDIFFCISWAFLE
jgi:hypothetical protein